MFVLLALLNTFIYKTTIASHAPLSILTVPNAQPKVLVPNVKVKPTICLKMVNVRVAQIQKLV